MDNCIRSIIEKLYKEHNAEDQELTCLLQASDSDVISSLGENARRTTESVYGKNVYLRGLIEFSNFCKNDCLYCGLRKSNINAERYRLTKYDILECCRKGYKLDFRTFVLQSGEDAYYSDDLICDIVRDIRTEFPDCAITLSIGEKSTESYKRFFDAGADRYLLRQETANPEYYAKLHPKELSCKNRLDCLFSLKEIGYQVGCGIMVNSPYQTVSDIICDIRFMQKLQPHMIGIGPFISHHDTPFANFPDGTLEQTLKLLSILRLLFPKVLLPATTALGTIHPMGREKGILAGANVVMPNLSPVETRAKYLIYDGKICTGDEAAECRVCMLRRIESIGYKVKVSRGDFPDFARK